MRYKKINVIGTSGSGKSTFAKKLAQKYNYPYLEIDEIFWLPNWTEPTDAVFFEKLESKLNEHPKWVLDGNYNRTVPIKWKDVDLIIWIDYSFIRTVYQAVKRAFMRALKRQELWPNTNNRESFKKAFFSRDSIIMWTLKTYGFNKKKYEKIFVGQEYSHVAMLRIRSPREALEFLEYSEIRQAENCC